MAFGLAILAGVADSITSVSGGTGAQVLVDGNRTALVVGAGILLGAAVLALFTPNNVGVGGALNLQFIAPVRPLEHLAYIESGLRLSSKCSNGLTAGVVRGGKRRWGQLNDRRHLS